MAFFTSSYLKLHLNTLSREPYISNIHHVSDSENEVALTDTLEAAVINTNICIKADIIFSAKFTNDNVPTKPETLFICIYMVICCFFLIIDQSFICCYVLLDKVESNS